MRSVTTISSRSCLDTATDNGVTTRRHIGRRGVVIGRLRYNSRDLKALRARVPQSECIPIKLDPADLSTIFVRDANTWLPIPCVNRPSYKTGRAARLRQQHHLSLREASRLPAFESALEPNFFSTRACPPKSSAPHHPHRSRRLTSRFCSLVRDRRPHETRDDVAGDGYDAAKREVDFALMRLALANRSVGRILSRKNSAPTSAVGRDIGDGYDIAKRDFDGASITLAHVMRSVARNIAKIKTKCTDLPVRNRRHLDILIASKNKHSPTMWWC